MKIKSIFILIFGILLTFQNIAFSSTEKKSSKGISIAQMIQSSDDLIKTGNFLDYVLNYENLNLKEIDLSSAKDKLIFANRDNSIKDYKPNDLTREIEAEKSLIRFKASSQEADREALENINEMFLKMKEEEFGTMIITSPYRPYNVQNYIYNSKVRKYKNEGKTAEEAKKLAEEYIALPGTSEHQTGLALDITVLTKENRSNPSVDTFTGTAESEWVKDNCWKYGFILRYPEDKEDMTKIKYESWHLRYLGKIYSEYIYKNKLCYEEFIQKIKNEKIIKYTSEGKEIYKMVYVNTEEKKIKLASLKEEIIEIQKFKENEYVITLKEN